MWLAKHARYAVRLISKLGDSRNFSPFFCTGFQYLHLTEGINSVLQSRTHKGVLELFHGHAGKHVG